LKVAITTQENAAGHSNACAGYEVELDGSMRFCYVHPGPMR
jgi:hypothetical protein